MAAHRIVFRAFVVAPLPLCLLMLPAAASKHPVTLKVLKTISQNVRGVGVAPGIEVTSAPVSCSPPYPSNTVSVQQQVPGYPSNDQCVLALPARDLTGTVHNRDVHALLTTQDGLQYYVILGCQKEYGWCDPLEKNTTYVGELNEQPKWLADYQHRPVTSFMKVRLRPAGKKKVTYQIEYAIKIAPSGAEKPDRLSPSFALKFPRIQKGGKQAALVRCHCRRTADLQPGNLHALP